MNLTTMKVSVPVLMLMMFQSGFCVEDWFEKAALAAKEGNGALFYTIVQEAAPDQLEKISAEKKTEFKKTWSKEISDAVTNILPLYYADKMGAGQEGETLRNAIVELGADGVITAGGYAGLDNSDADHEINTKNVNRLLVNQIVTTANITNADRSWLLPNGNYVSGEATGVGINKWVKDLINNWGIDQSASNGADYTQEDNKKLLLGKFNDNDFELRAKIQLGGDQNNNGGYKNNPEVIAVFNAVKTCEIPAGGTNPGQLDPAKTEEITVSLRNALLDVLATRATVNAAGNNNAANYATDGPGDLFVRTYRDRVVVNASATAIDYDDGNGGQHHNPLRAIVDEAGTTLDVANIKNAVDNVISADLSHILRHSGSVSVDALDKAIADSTANTTQDANAKIKDGLQSVAQTFDDATASSIVSNLKAIKTNQP